MVLLNSLDVAEQGARNKRSHRFAATIDFMMFVTLQGFSLEIIALLGVAVILVGLGLIVPDHLHVSFEEFGGGEAREVGYDHVLFDPWVLHNLAEVGLIGNLGQEVVVVFKYFSDH